MIRITSDSSDETIKLGYKLGASAVPGTIILLSGDLGTGKTVLSKGIASGLLIDTHITSPSYTIMKQYEGRLQLNHFDLYRIGDAEELYDLDYEEYFYGEGVTIVEWPSRMDFLYPEIGLAVDLKYSDIPDERFITIKALDELHGDILDNMKLEAL